MKSFYFFGVAAVLATGCERDWEAKPVMRSPSSSMATESRSPSAFEPGGPSAAPVPRPASVDNYYTPEDQIVTEALRLAYAADPVLAAAASRVRIVTGGGRIALTGTVATAAQRDALVKRTQDLAKGREVADELKIANENR